MIDKSRNRCISREISTTKIDENGGELSIYRRLTQLCLSATFLPVFKISKTNLIMTYSMKIDCR